MARRASLSVIERKIAELQKKAEAIRLAGKPGIRQLKAVIARFRLSRADLFGVFGGGNSRPARASPLAGTKVAPKYRNPANRLETWSGRGLRPGWLVAAMKAGRKQDDFLIAKPGFPRRRMRLRGNQGRASKPAKPGKPAKPDKRGKPGKSRKAGKASRARAA